MYERNTLSAPHPRRNPNGNNPNPNRPRGNGTGFKKPAGHQSALTKHKGKADISIALMHEDRLIVGRLIDSDRYTITVEREGASEQDVVFKHAILSFIISPDAETTND